MILQALWKRLEWWPEDNRLCNTVCPAINVYKCVYYTLEVPTLPRDTLVVSFCFKLTSSFVLCGYKWTHKLNELNRLTAASRFKVIRSHWEVIRYHSRSRLFKNGPLIECITVILSYDHNRIITKFYYNLQIVPRWDFVNFRFAIFVISAFMQSLPRATFLRIKIFKASQAFLWGWLFVWDCSLGWAGIKPISLPCSTSFTFLLNLATNSSLQKNACPE